MSQWAHNVLALALGLAGIAVLIGIAPVKDPFIGATLVTAAGVPIFLGSREKAKEREAARTGSVPLQEPKP